MSFNKNKKEKLMYTILICFSMEFLLAYYNYFFHTDAFLDEAFLLACIEFIPAFLVGVICEWIFISKTAKKISYYLHHKHFKQRDIIHINEFCIVIGMMLVITIFGAFYHSEQYTTHIFYNLAYDFFKNSIFGVPLFMFIISPVSRKIVKKYLRK